MWNVYNFKILFKVKFILKTFYLLLIFKFEIMANAQCFEFYSCIKFWWIENTI